MATQKYRLLSGHHRVASSPKKNDAGQLVGSGRVFINTGDVIESDKDLTKVFPGRFELVKATKSEAKAAEAKES